MSTSAAGSRSQRAWRSTPTHAVTQPRRVIPQPRASPDARPGASPKQPGAATCGQGLQRRRQSRGGVGGVFSGTPPDGELFGVFDGTRKLSPNFSAKLSHHAPAGPRDQADVERRNDRASGRSRACERVGAPSVAGPPLGKSRVPTVRFGMVARAGDKGARRSRATVAASRSTISGRSSWPAKDIDEAAPALPEEPFQSPEEDLHEAMPSDRRST